MRTLRLRSALPTTLIAALAACTAADGPPDEDEIVAAIEQPNGGLDMEDEAPLFGDAEQYDAAALERDGVDFRDELDDTAMTDLRNLAGAEHHRVVLLWGQLPPDRDEPNGKDWTGAFQLARGAMVVRRTIGFEDATDHVIRPRTDRNTVAFASVTRPFADGLVLEVVDPTPATGLVLGYHGAAGEYELDLAELATGPIVIDVDDQGNKLVAVSLRRLVTDPCNHGFMRGRWHQIRPGLGRYLGIVADADGNRIGHVRGIYGVRENGERVVFGKLIDRDGRFNGILAGHYREGRFAARWILRTGDAGRIHGVYRESIPGEETGGGFAARWAETTCAQDLPDDMP
jgi:hypothetical protein